MLEFKNVTKIYSPKKGTKKVALDNISFLLPTNGLIFLLGKSGSGKTTLLNLLGTLDKPTNGDIIVNDKNISNFKEKELTSYRSTHIGFIFQEFNLLEDLNIYDNIDISLNLKKIKSTKEMLDKYLDIVGLNGLGLRKVGELSGGEKQRVSIARALIKNPSIILADEPTGNLDSINSEQIFNILKQISKKHLVVVVSHDRENAYKYADGILEIADGKIINNTIHIEENIYDKEFKLNKSHISFFKRLKLAFGMLKNKKIRLAITVLLLTIAFSLFGFSYSLMNFDIPRTHAETMVHENESNIILNKGIISDYRLYNMLTEAEVNNIMNNLNSNYYQESYLYQNNKLSKLSLEYNPKYENIRSNAYYSIYNEYLKFIIYDEEQLNNLDIVGNIPVNSDEVLITELLAEYLIIYGFREYETQKNEIEYQSTFIETQEELLGKKIYIENGYIIISGIIKDENLQKFEELKEVSQNQMNKKPTKLYNEFRSLYANNLYNIYVGKDFVENTELESNCVIDNSTFDNILFFEGREYYDGVFLKLLSNELEIYNGKQLQKVKSVNNGEIILSSVIVEWIADGKVMETYIEKGKKLKEEYNKKVADREKKIEEQYEKLQNDPNYVYVEIPEIEEPDYTKLIQDIIIDEINERELIGKEITIELLDKHHIYSEQDSIKYTFKIVGVAIGDAYSYVGNDMIDYTFSNMITSSIVIEEDNKEELINIFNNFNNKNYNMTTRFSSSINAIVKVVKSIEKVSSYITVGFLIFAVILLTLFITNNLSVNKRKIGILRALGTKTKDILIIFMLEGSIIGIFTLILSIFGTIISIYFANNYITKELFFYARPIIFNINSIISILIVVSVIILTSLVIPIIQISKIKPIELIQNK